MATEVVSDQFSRCHTFLGGQSALDSTIVKDYHDIPVAGSLPSD